ncbi:sulfotransferase family protein [Methylobacterium sp. C33D]
MIYFLVSGAPRSGTSVLQQILNTHSEISCFHEYGLNDLAKRVDTLFDVERSRNAMYAGLEITPTFYSPALNEDQSDRADPLEAPLKSFDPAPIPARDRHYHKIINAIFAAISGKMELKAVGDKMPNVVSGAYMDQLLPQFPGIKLVLIIRHPANVIKSSLARAAAAKERRDAWHIETFDEALDEWVNNWEFAAKINQDENYSKLFLKYENLRDNFDGEMKRVADFLSVSSTFVNLIEPSMGNGDKFRLSAEQEARIAERVGPLIKAWEKDDAYSLLSSFQTLPYIIESGEMIDASGNGLLPHVLRDGFYPVEDWGAWTNGTHARIVFKIRSAKAIEDVWLDLSFMGFVGDMTDFVFGITVNSGPLEMISVDAATAQGPIANVGRLFKVVDGLVAIKLSVPRPKMRVQEPITDSRSVGLGLKSIRATIL